MQRSLLDIKIPDVGFLYLKCLFDWNTKCLITPRTLDNPLLFPRNATHFLINSRLRFRVWKKHQAKVIKRRRKKWPKRLRNLKPSWTRDTIRKSRISKTVRAIRKRFFHYLYLYLYLFIYWLRMITSDMKYTNNTRSKSQPSWTRDTIRKSRISKTVPAIRKRFFHYPSIKLLLH